MISPLQNFRALGFMPCDTSGLKPRSRPFDAIGSKSGVRSLAVPLPQACEEAIESTDSLRPFRVVAFRGQNTLVLKFDRSKSLRHRSTKMTKDLQGEKPVGL